MFYKQIKAKNQNFRQKMKKVISNKILPWTFKN